MKILKCMSWADPEVGQGVQTAAEKSQVPNKFS